MYTVQWGCWLLAPLEWVAGLGMGTSTARGARFPVPNRSYPAEREPARSSPTHPIARLSGSERLRRSTAKILLALLYLFIILFTEKKWDSVLIVWQTHVIKTYLRQGRSRNKLWHLKQPWSAWSFPELLALCAGNSPVTGEFLAQRPWRGALVFSLICSWISGWVNNREASDSRRHRAHYDVTVMLQDVWAKLSCNTADFTWNAK